MLTGKCKKDFEKWLIKNKSWSKTYINAFYEFDKSMQYGVYVDFFDDVGVEVRVVGQKLANNSRYYESYTNEYLGACRSRSKARTEAIKKSKRNL